MPNAVLEIKDEVNVRIHGVDQVTLEKARNALTYFFPAYMHTPMYKLGRWDGRICLLSGTGMTMLNLFEDISPIFEKAGYRFEVVDQRKDWSGVVDQLVLPTDQLFAEYTLKGEPVVLRDYQLAAVHEAMKCGSGLLQLATGSGKTLICAAISKIYMPHGHVVVIVPDIGLILQTQYTFNQVGLNAGSWYMDAHDRRQVTICTWQSLDKSPELFEDTACVILDECFSGETPILTNNGWKRIDLIVPGEIVVAFDGEKFQYETVVKLHENLPTSSSEDFYRLDFDDGSFVEVTGNHKFLTNRGWVRADELIPDDELVGINKDALRECQNANEIIEKINKDK